MQLRPWSRARSTKTSEEVQALRNAARVADAAQSALVSASKTFGGSEFGIWSDILEAVYRSAEEVVPVFGELVTGPRTNEVHYPGGPRNRLIGRGDTGILDISMRVNGYWSDCCNTVVFGAEPSRDQRKYMEASKDCLSAALDVLRPGARCSDVAEAIERTHARHGVTSPRFYGHQIGVVVNERPRLIPSDATTIRAGMVFCLEPGAYAGRPAPLVHVLRRWCMLPTAALWSSTSFPGDSRSVDGRRPARRARFDLEGPAFPGSP